MQSPGYGLLRRSAVLLLAFPVLMGCASEETALLTATAFEADLDASTALATPSAEFAAARIRPVDKHKKDSKHGAYIGGGATLSHVGEEWDGTTTFIDTVETFFIPELDDETGFAAQIGYRWKGTGIEIGADRTVYEGKFGGLPVDDTTFYSVNVDLKQYIWTESTLQPYFLLGLGYVLAEVENGASNGTVFKDLEMDGTALNLGAGLSLDLGSHLSLFGQGKYRYLEFSNGEGFDGAKAFNTKLDSHGWVVLVGLNYFF